MNIVCHAFPAWDGNYVKSTVELMKAAAAQGHRILYVDYAYTWTDFFKGILGKSGAPWRRMVGVSPRIRSEQGLHILSLPPVLPSNFLKNPRWHDVVDRLNSKWMGHFIRRATRQLGMEGATVVNAFNPSFGVHLAGRLGERRLVYYCYDEIGAAAWAGRHGARLERKFMGHCDAVVVSSEGLRTKQAARHDAVFTVKNGVDATLFCAEVPQAALPTLPNWAQGQPVIGYLGSVDDRLDIGLLEGLFRQFAHAKFVFVGRVQDRALQARLAAFPNVFLAGAQAPAALPGWVARMDVCLIPFVKNEFTAGIYPLKINEYLAAGKPVVSTDFAPLADFSGIVAITDSAEAFEKSVAEALRPCAPDVAQAAVSRRRAFALGNDWSEKAKQFVAICDQNPG